MRLVIRAGKGGLWWTMVRSSSDYRPVARAVIPSPDVEGCRRAAAVLSGSGLHKSPVREGEGRWRWQVSDPSGTVVAESADTFESAAACGYNLYEVRHHLARQDAFAARRAAVRQALARTSSAPAGNSRRRPLPSSQADCLPWTV